MTADVQAAIKIILHPAVGGFPNAWEFTLIIVVALLAISFLASVGMHWHLWRIRRRQRERFEQQQLQQTEMEAGTTAVLQKKIMDTDSLALFPVRVFGDQQPTTLTRINSQQRSSRAIQNAELLIASEKPAEQQQQQDSNTDTGIIATDNDNDESSCCVICLDEFVVGDEIRELPCGHEYHCECIGKFMRFISFFFFFF
ncbi:MAG: hypothetical protein EXX96DRAFT_477798 [Benjaminiella poitrasii]|nr:MAG: hypothetical protein EXX96DRAFT_477798 [Benjaminiella poitrasii]